MAAKQLVVFVVLLISFSIVIGQFTTQQYEEQNTCTLPALLGEYDNYTIRWHYSTVDKRCQQFYYGGCGGNTNNFPTEESCLQKCKPPITQPPVTQTPVTKPPTTTHPTEKPVEESMYISPNCTDNPLFAYCQLIVMGHYCDHRYYRRYCCLSCTKAEIFNKTTNNTLYSDAAPLTNSNKINRYLNNCGRPMNHIPLIHGGTEPARDQYLWLSSLFRSRYGSLNFTCGGSLITDRHVMTAAHCIQNRKSNKIPLNQLIVMVGKFDIDDWVETGVFTSRVSHYYIHEMFNTNGRYNNDIAVLVLEKTVDFVQFSNIRTVCLWSMDSTKSTIVGQKGVVVGWGMDETGRQITSTPRELSVPIVSQVDCLYSDAYYFINNKTLCGGSKDGKGPCTGDSGGGLFMWVGGRYYIRGIISLSLRDPETRSCDLREYSIYTDVAKYMSWIENKVEII